MQTAQDATTGLIDFRELVELLPNVNEDVLASEFITGRIPALVRNSCGTLDEYELPMAYDAERDAWSIDRAGAREGRFLFRLADVRALAGRHPEWLASPEPDYDPELRPLAQTLPIVLELETERNKLKDALKHSFEVINSQLTELAKLRHIETEYAVLEKQDAVRRQTVETLRSIMGTQDAAIAEQGRRIAELEAELAKAQSVACIGDGLLRTACDFRRENMDRDIMAAKLYDCRYKPSYGVVRCLVSTPSELAGDVKFPTEGNDAVSNRRTASGKTMVSRGKEKLNEQG